MRTIMPTLIAVSVLSLSCRATGERLRWDIGQALKLGERTCDVQRTPSYERGGIQIG